MCEGNLYIDPDTLKRDLITLISWNQLFRADSVQAFLYLSQLYQQMVDLLLKKDLHRRFYKIKREDLGRILNYETQFKTNCDKWPIVPSSFREYTVVDEYVPTPAPRTPIIQDRLISKK